jgi:hypothetical protein
MVKVEISLKKTKALLTTLALGLTLSLSVANNASAAKDNTEVKKEKQGNLKIESTYYPIPVEYDFKDVAGAGISPMFIPYTGDEYEVGTKSTYKAKSWGTVITNSSTVNDSVSRTVSRTTFATGKIGTSAETAVNWKIIKGKIGINAEVSWGTTDTVYVTYNWGIPAKTTTTIATGSLAVQTTGQVVHYSNGVATKRTAVDAKWSYDDYADKTSKPL